jgi:hypothetical protein
MFYLFATTLRLAPEWLLFSTRNRGFFNIQRSSTMSASITAFLDSKDDHTLVQVISQAQAWIGANRDQARDVLLDEPLLRFVLVEITKILDRRYRSYDFGAREAGPRLQPSQYRQHQMPAGFYTAGPSPYAVYPQGQPPRYSQYAYSGYPGYPYFPGYPPQPYGMQTQPMQPHMLKQAPLPPQPPEEWQKLRDRVMKLTDDDIAQLGPEERKAVEDVRRQVLGQRM